MGLSEYIIVIALFSSSLVAGKPRRNFRPKRSIYDDLDNSKLARNFNSVLPNMDFLPSLQQLREMARLALQQPQLYGGDIKLKPEKAFSEPVLEEAAIKGNSYRWYGYPGKGRVPYILDDSVSNIRSIIQAAMDQYCNLTCVCFYPRTNEHDYISIYSGTGCSSYVGRVGGQQDVSLGDGCQYIGTAVHELGHAVGLYHEHQRFDRDQYITVKFNNVKPGSESQFDKEDPTVDLTLANYNYNSIMHYGNYAFSKSPFKLKTLIAHNGQTLEDPYDKLGLDKTDIAVVRKLYKCDQ